ncbi:hypothetical protein MTR67_020232 [Solanum verrucosum]|uniref:Uncharacterized protein n=1 Tax=Solanum verrucosum TaxID=315347 RepID=A0AAF0QMY2_SOLVR|nr:hypothetical protein MTR67_020232 [Solanum verrucosum]
MITYFIQAQDSEYYKRMVTIGGKTFAEVIKAGEMIEDGLKTGRIASYTSYQFGNRTYQTGSFGKKKEKEAIQTPEPANQKINPASAIQQPSDLTSRTFPLSLLPDRFENRPELAERADPKSMSQRHWIKDTHCLIDQHIELQLASGKNIMIAAHENSLRKHYELKLFLSGYKFGACHWNPMLYIFKEGRFIC